MKITKTEKIWLIAVIVLYVCYNLPFVPAYHNAFGTLVHGVLTLIPLWIVIYVGLVKVCRIYKLKDMNTVNENNVSDTRKINDIKEDAENA